VIRASDAEILVILLCHQTRLNLNIWMDMGHSSDNTRRHANISHHACHLGPVICKSLPGLHALTGCDYESSFARKRKTCPFGIVQKNPIFLEGLGNLGEKESMDEATDKIMEQLVCAMCMDNNK
jgi:hypothetical protein